MREGRGDHQGAADHRGGEGAAGYAGDAGGGADPCYLTSFRSARSEIIVPVRTTPEALVEGAITVESEKMAAFGPEDEELLHACAEALIPLWT